MFDTAGQSAGDMIRELRSGARIAEINSVYYIAAIELVVQGYGTARVVTRKGMSTIWSLEDGSLAVVDVPKSRVYQPVDDGDTKGEG